ncbi:MAG: hypothetical protein Q4D88_00035 [Anaerococcus sp.]|nr:hypothetical protein [Anaerococcus sp.]
MKEDLFKEFKAISILLFSIFLGIFIGPSRALVYLILASFLILVLIIFIGQNNLRIARIFLNLFLAIYNVISLAFMVQYILKSPMEPMYGYFLGPFLGDFSIYYIGSIFVISLIFIFLQAKFGEDDGK